MLGKDPSLWRQISVGMVLVNQTPGNPVIEVLPIEISPFVDGELVPNATVLESEGVDGSGNKYKVAVTATNSVSATWYKGDSSRQSPPNVRRGETVEVWQYADEDKYYWKATGIGQEHRRLETVIYAISASSKEDAKVLTPDNAYLIEWSSHKKVITLSTSKANGEANSYMFQFNLGEGVVTLADDMDQFFEMDSQERSFIMQNADQTRFELNKKRIFMRAGEQIQADTKNLDINCDTMTINANLLQGNITTTNLTGTLTVDKLVTMKMNSITMGLATVGTFAMGPAAAAGAGAPLVTGGTSGMTFKIKVELDGANVEVTGGDIIHEGISVGKDHTHTSGAPGSPTSGVTG